MSELSDEIMSKRETLLARRGHLIRILALMILLLSLVPIASQIGFTLNPPIEFAILLVLIALSLAVSLLISVILCLGALMAEESENEEFRGVFFKGNTIKEGEGSTHREVMKEADKLLKIYDEAERESLKSIGIWAFTALWITLFISLGALVVRVLQPELSDLTLLILSAVFVILFPSVIISLYPLYLWNEVINKSDAWKSFADEASEGHEYLKQQWMYRYLILPFLKVPVGIYSVLSSTKSWIVSCISSR